MVHICDCAPMLSTFRGVSRFSSGETPVPHAVRLLAAAVGAGRCIGSRRHERLVADRAKGLVVADAAAVAGARVGHRAVAVFAANALAVARRGRRGPPAGGGYRRPRRGVPGPWWRPSTTAVTDTCRSGRLVTVRRNGSRGSQVPVTLRPRASSSPSAESRSKTNGFTCGRKNRFAQLRRVKLERARGVQRKPSLG